MRPSSPSATGPSRRRSTSPSGRTCRRSRSASPAGRRSRKRCRPKGCCPKSSNPPGKEAMLPSVFISHGSPMHALQPGAAGEAWKALAQRLPRPRAILIASAHSETNLPMLTGSEKPETIHDFYNFPEPLYRLRYPAPGAPDVAQRAQALLKDAGFTAGIDGCRGLDHGAWSPLLYMYPKHEIPVVQISVQPGLGPRHPVELGKAVRKLSDEGVLIIGSGHMTHNLRDWGRGTKEPQPYARELQ